MAIPLILTMLRLGIPTAKIIAKYGKKAYLSAKKKDLDLGAALTGMSIGGGAVASVLGKKMKKINEKKKLKIPMKKK